MDWESSQALAKYCKLHPQMGLKPKKEKRALNENLTDYGTAVFAYVIYICKIYNLH